MRKKLTAIFMACIMAALASAPAARAAEASSAAEEPAATQAEQNARAAEASSAPEEPATTQAEQKARPGNDVIAERTILMYNCGSNLETTSGYASVNLRQILNANFSADNDVNFIVMNAGSDKWHLEGEYLCDPDNIGLSADEETGEYVISGTYNQVWEAKGMDAHENPGKLVLLDADGITGAKGTAVKAEDELMSDPDVLRAFIDYGVTNYPAKRYDLILKDHGGGPLGAFCVDQHDQTGEMMSFDGLVDALSHNKAVDADGDGKQDGRFDLVNIDACLMGSIELSLVLADYADYYIASPKTEPGPAEYYTGWLDKLGEDPSMDTYELGKIIVDDFNDFYEYGEGKGQEATLAVTDLRKLTAPETGFISALTEMAEILKEQAAADPDTGDILFYDEFDATWGAIQYSGESYFDLGNMAALLGVAGVEITEDDILGGSIDSTNAYTDVSERISAVFSDEEIIYAKGTRGVKSEDQLYRVSDGSLEHGTLTTSGLYAFLPMISFINDEMKMYYDCMEPVIEKMPESDRKEFLSKYREAMIDYSLVRNTGTAVSRMINEYGKDKGEIDYEKVKNEFWIEDWARVPGMENYSFWKDHIEPRLDMRGGGETEEARAWLDAVIRKQADEAIDKDEISAVKIAEESGDAYLVTIDDVKKAVVKSVERNVMAELPAMETYLQDFDEFAREELRKYGKLSLGTIRGIPYEDSSLLPDDGDEQEYLENLVRWLNDKESVWEIAPLEPEWYAISDADGNLHVANIDDVDAYTIIATACYGPAENRHLIYLSFDREQGNKLTKVYFKPEGGGTRCVETGDLTEELEVLSAIYATSFMGDDTYYIPVSGSSFTVTADNWESITCDMVPVSRINDIQDVDGDGREFYSTVSVTDIYRSSIDITDILNDPAEELTSIELVRVRPEAANGKERVPVVTYKGKTLKEGTDYTWQKLPSTDVYVEAGEYMVHLEGKGRFSGRTNKDFCIVSSEEELAETYLSEAQELALKAENFFDVRNSYKARQVFNAQNALADALNTLERSKDSIPEGKQQEIEVAAAEAEKKIKALNDKLAAAGEIDFSNYYPVMKDKFMYTGSEIEPEISVPVLSASDYTVAYSDNVEAGTANADITGAGVYSGKISGKFAILLEEPMITNLAGNNDGVKVVWDAVPGAARYVVYRKTGGGSWEKIAVTAAESATDAGSAASVIYTDLAAAAGKKYTYTVRCAAEDEKNYTSSYDKKGKSITYAAVPVLSTFRNLSSGIEVTWKKSAGAEKYRVYRKPAASDTASERWEALGDTTETKYVDKKVTGGKKYTYTVRCVTGDGRTYTSGYSKDGKAYVYAGRPEFSGVASVKAGQLTVKWTKVPGITGYRIQYCTDSAFGSGFKTVTVGKASAVSRTLSGLKSGKKYYVRIRSCKTVGDKTYSSAWSKVRAGTVK